MSDPRYEKAITGKVQGDGNQTIVLADVRQYANQCIEHQIDVIPEGATSGTAAVMVKRRGTTVFAALKDQYGAAVVINLAAPDGYIIRGRIDAVRVDPTSVTGGDGTYGIRLNGLQ